MWLGLGLRSFGFGVTVEDSGSLRAEDHKQHTRLGFRV